MFKLAGKHLAILSSLAPCIAYPVGIFVVEVCQFRWDGRHLSPSAQQQLQKKLSRLGHLRSGWLSPVWRCSTIAPKRIMHLVLSRDIAVATVAVSRSQPLSVLMVKSGFGACAVEREKTGILACTQTGRRPLKQILWIQRRSKSRRTICLSRMPRCLSLCPSCRPRQISTERTVGRN